MKKIFFLICLASIVLLSSCGNTVVSTTPEPTTVQTTESVESTTDTEPSTVDTSELATEETTEETSVSNAEETTTEIHDLESSYLDDLQEYLLFMSTNDVFMDKFELYPNCFTKEATYGVALRYRVLGIEQLDYDYTIYQIQVLEAYGMEEEYDTEKIYSMAYRGTPEKALYDRPALQVGKEYLRPSSSSFVKFDLLQPSFGLPIEYIDGEIYVYGYGIDYSQLDCAIEITDETENQIYKPGIHDKYIELATEKGYPLPTFDYKCELYAMLEELFGIEKTEK